MTTDREALTSQADYLDAIAAAIRKVNARLDAMTRTDLESRLGVGGAVHDGMGPIPRSLFGSGAVGATLGNTDPVIGQANALQDPLLMGWPNVVQALALADQTLSRIGSSAAWRARTTTATSGAQAQRVYRYTDPGNDPYNSGLAEVRMKPTVAGTHEAIVESSAWTYDYPVFAPYLVAALSLVAQGYTPETQGGRITSNTVTLEIVNNTTLSIVASAALDYLRVANGTRQRLVAAYTKTSGTLSDGYRWRLRWTLVVTDALPNPEVMQFVEPQLHPSLTPDPLPYAPLWGVLDPLDRREANIEDTGPFKMSRWDDAIERFVLGVDGSHYWGPGNAARDARLRRSATKELTIDNAAAGPVRLKHVGPLFIQGPTAMDLAISYGADGPTLIERSDESAAVSSTAISYAGGKPSAIVTTRFGKTITVVPTYTGDKITAIARDVT